MDDFARFVIVEFNHEIRLACKECNGDPVFMLKKGNGEPMDWRGYTISAIRTYLNLHNEDCHS